MAAEETEFRLGLMAVRADPEARYAGGREGGGAEVKLPLVAYEDGMGSLDKGFT